MEDKLNRLLRKHRQHVFDEKTGDAHARAIKRLKKTQTFRLMAASNEVLAAIRAGKRLTRLGY
jgi:hypothetical protein